MPYLILFAIIVYLLTTFWWVLAGISIIWIIIKILEHYQAQKELEDIKKKDKELEEKIRLQEERNQLERITLQEKIQRESEELDKQRVEREKLGFAKRVLEKQREKENLKKKLLEKEESTKQRAREVLEKRVLERKYQIKLQEQKQEDIKILNTKIGELEISIDKLDLANLETFTLYYEQIKDDYLITKPLAVTLETKDKELFAEFKIQDLKKLNIEGYTHKDSDAISYYKTNCISLIYLISKFDYKKHFDTLSLDIIVDYTSGATGITTEKRVCSLSVERSKIDSIVISEVDPESCFAFLQGSIIQSVQSLESDSYEGVRPQSNIKTTDRRFIESEQVLDYNLQSLFDISWQEFEVLVKDILQKHYGSETCNVNLTQSSRDGGVDAIIIDTDPFKGRKIVVQAKQYSNVVGVSNVRDLFGTLQNEGADRGILITTSNYGTDSYKFANGKPITLINGKELLSLLKEHGFEMTLTKS